MNVREVLEKLVRDDEVGPAWVNVDKLAPIIEKGLRAAYNRGHTVGLAGHPVVKKDGVTAGVAAMVDHE